MAASKTAEYVAMYRALETSERRRAPLFRDPLAAAFLTGVPKLALVLARIRGLRGALEWYSDQRAPGARTSAIGRTRFIDDVVQREVGRGTAQIVVLGAGYDCRAHRLPELGAATVFEVDRADTQAVKRRRIADAGKGAGKGARATGAEVRYVPVDFTVDDVTERLTAAGFRADRPTLFLWEGVTNYLDEAAVAGVLTMVGKALAGSAIVFTYIHRGVIDGSVRFPGGDKLVASVRALGEPWRFGLALEEDLGADDYRRRYLGDDARLRGYAFYRIAVARVVT